MSRIGYQLLVIIIGYLLSVISERGRGSRGGWWRAEGRSVIGYELSVTSGGDTVRGG
jgi:hypothetical protein